MLYVTCAIIEQGGRVLVAQRGPGMDMAGLWEFPGGKLHEGESDEACIVREIAEELGLHIAVRARLPQCVHHYPHLSICLLPFVAHIAGGALHLAEHAQARWLLPAELPPLLWCAADVPVWQEYVKWLEQ